MSDELLEPERVVEFHLLRSLPDAHPIVVKVGAMLVSMSFLVSD